MKRAILIGVAVLALAGLAAGCGSSDADVAAKNISKAAEQFEVYRRVVVFNGITDKYLLVVEGFCSVETTSSSLGGSLEITCKTSGKGADKFKKSYAGLSDNVSFFVEQRDAINVSTTHYRVIFKPEVIVPDFDRP